MHRLIVSFADPEHAHIGTVYQGAGWIYVGAPVGCSSVMLNGKQTHRRTINSKYGTSAVEWLRIHVDPNAKAVWTKPKYKYLWPLDAEMREKILPLEKPYPKRAASVDSDTPAHQAGEGGASPTAALQASRAQFQG